MKKKKMKLWKKVLIILLILLLIFIISITRKAIILANLDKKVTDYENNNNNIYVKTTLDFSNYKAEMERFIKDDVDKLVSERTDIDGRKIKIMQITYPNERKIYTEVDNNKVLNIFEEPAGVRGSHIENNGSYSYTAIMNFAYSTNLYERIYNSLVTKIKSIEMDGKECYELSSLYSTNLIYGGNTTNLLVYVEKDTGLPVKMIEEVNENNEIVKNITTYEYSFGTVTDEDIKEPDNTQYKIAEY